MHPPEVVVITGASAGVGRATAREFARRGARIGLVARGRERLERAREEVERLGGRGLALPGDVADAVRVDQIAAEVEDRFGPIDVWINNAMLSVFSPVVQKRPEEYRRVTEVTYLGVVHGTLAALRRMRLRDRGTIVQVGSALAYRAIPLQSAYCAAKHAAHGFTESLRTELLHEGSRIRLTEVHLPAVNTPQFEWTMSRLPHRAQPVPPIFQPEVPARVIYWAAHHERRELFAGWPTAKAVLGDKLVPSYADQRLARIGYDSQQTDEPENPSRPHNLWQPVPGDFAAHGRFDARARGFSLQLWLSLHRGWLALAGLGLAGASATLAALGRGRQPWAPARLAGRARHALVAAMGR
jgi:NAD(P)-dependent dehydrogenase (short-subunit alcohol dehydrogenase family)